MEQTTLYRKYRPNCFNNVVGQKAIIKTLQNSILSDSLFHSYIFFGSHGCGKTSIARIFAKVLNCTNPIENDCCNKCENCLNSNNSLDIIEIDAASNSGVDEIRKIIENVDYLPIKLKKKIYIIDEAHMLSNSAWNALLKTIEEPPQHVIFIFATTEINKIPMTIMSRCQRFDFSKLDFQEINHLLDSVCQQEGILISNDAKYKINILSNGSARDCLSILQQVSDYTNKSITIESINEIFGFVNLEEKINFIKLFKTNPNSIISKLSNITTNYLNFVSDLIEIIMDKLTYLYTNDANLLKVLTVSNIYEIDLDESMCQSLLDLFVSIYEKIKQFDKGLFYFQTKIINFLKDHQTQSSTCLEKKDEVSISISTNEVQNEQIDPRTYFKTKVVMENIPKQSSTPKIDIDNQLLFNQIATNTSSKNKSKFSEIFNTLKLSSNQEHKELLLAEKVVTASNSGILLLFQFENDLNEFNQWYWNPNSMNKVCDLFGQKIIILGGTKQNIQAWKNAIDINQKYLDVQIDEYLPDIALSEEDKIKKILEINNLKE